MDRERLREVHQTDLTESRVNEDFIDWMKNSGPTWLLVILVALAAYLGINRWREAKVSKANEAWAAFAEAQLPGSLVDVANQYGTIGQVGNLARIRAADQLLLAVQANRELSDLNIDPQQPTPPEDAAAEEPLSDEQRAEYLDRADRLYDEIIANDDGSFGMTLHAVGAMHGKAAVAESRGDIDTAREWYTKAAERAEGHYAGLAQQARQRAENVEQYVTAPQFQPQQQAQRQRPPAETRDPVQIDPALEDLLMPEDAESGG
jgi:hypothetical protein